MQTFLPYGNFADSARVLDRQRLGKQRVETLQIMNALVHKHGWQNHPAVKMWRGHEGILMQYQEAICHEWIVERGYRDTCLESTQDIYDLIRRRGDENQIPFWLGDEEFHLAHRPNLLRKDHEHYGPIFGDIPDDLGYVWPVR